VIGTIINVVAILLGGMVGIWFGARLPERIRQTCFAGLGLFTLVIGVQMALKTQQSLIVLASLMVGGILGEWWQIEDRLRALGGWLEIHFAGGSADQSKNVADELEIDPKSTQTTDATTTAVGSRFIRGFLAASLVFVIGPIAILGSIQDGLRGDYSLLAVKSVMDGFASVAFASSLGVGVLFSSLVILVYQGGISLLATQAQALITPPMMTEMTATGGVLLLGIAISSLLEIKVVRVGNFVPALAIAPMIVAALKALGIG
jgi:uncharacterized protein